MNDLVKRLRAVVPVEPTFEMCRAAKWSLERAKERDGKLQHDRPYTAEEKHAIRWRAMLDAAGAEKYAEGGEVGVGVVIPDPLVPRP